jgi:hypothetical protein
MEGANYGTAGGTSDAHYTTGIAAGGSNGGNGGNGKVVIVY